MRRCKCPTAPQRVAGATEATRGCKHRCRHCPIVPVYDGQFRVVPLDVVLADIDQQVPPAPSTSRSAIRISSTARRTRGASSRRLHARHPARDLRRHDQGRAPAASTAACCRCSREPGCLFITSAVESVDDEILAETREGTYAGRFRTRPCALCRGAGVRLAPTFVAFTPWTTIDGYRDLLDTVDDARARRPRRTGAMGAAAAGHAGFAAAGARRTFARASGRSITRTLTYPWKHDDPRGRSLQAEIMRAVGVSAHRARDGDVRHGLCAGRARRLPRRLLHASRSERRSRISTSPGTVERSQTQSRWLWCNVRVALHMKRVLFSRRRPAIRRGCLERRRSVWGQAAVCDGSLRSARGSMVGRRDPGALPQERAAVDAIVVGGRQSRRSTASWRSAIGRP